MTGGRSLRILFAGGGTGGHVYPALAMERALAARGDVRSMFIGARGGMEASILKAHNVTAELLPGFGLRGASLLRRLLAPFVMCVSVARAMRVIARFRPHVVVGTGGYASAAAVIAAVLSRVPRVLQEQNSVPGLVNRRLARFADLVLLSFEGSSSALPAGVDTQVVGNPLRDFETVDRAAAAAEFGLDPDGIAVLVIGGSRGASKINRAAVEAAEAILSHARTQILLATGEHDYETARASLASYGSRAAVVPYIDNMSAAYSLADVAVARAGASSVFELAAFGIPTVFVPYPHAADDHQRRNVEPLVAAGAAKMCQDGELDGARLSREIAALIESAGMRESMRAALTPWSARDAAARAAEAIMEVSKKKVVEGRDGRIAVVAAGY